MSQVEFWRDEAARRLNGCDHAVAAESARLISETWRGLAGRYHDFDHIEDAGPNCALRGGIVISECLHCDNQIDDCLTQVAELIDA